MEVGEFFDFRLWRPDLSHAQWSAFIGWRKHASALLSLNQLPYRCLTENKLLFYLLCQALGVPTPRVYAVVDPYRSRSAMVPTLRAAEEIPRLLSDLGESDVVIKPVNGTRGRAVWVLRYDRDHGFSTIQGRKLSSDEFREVLHYEFRGATERSFLIQERLVPHECTKHLNTHCPFSYRVITLVDDHGEPQILFTYAKLASEGSLSDNLHAGGLALLADRGGTCLGARGEKSYHDLLTRHPTLDFELCGWKLPFFEDVQSLAVRVASEFSLVRCVAWDIAVSRQGLMVYEGNNPFNHDIQLVYDTGLWQGLFAAEAAIALKSARQLPPWWG
jgi:hypothetical protein